jgi:hypothetical protein
MFLLHRQCLVKKGPDTVTVFQHLKVVEAKIMTTKYFLRPDRFLGGDNTINPIYHSSRWRSERASTSTNRDRDARMICSKNKKSEPTTPFFVWPLLMFKHITYFFNLKKPRQKNIITFDKSRIERYTSSDGILKGIPDIFDCGTLKLQR